MEASNNLYVSYNNSSNYYYAEEEEEKRSTTLSSKYATTTTFYSSLHAVQKPIIMKKKSIAPFPPTKPRVYKVHPAKFKELVQRLTASGPGRRLDEIAPPPLDLTISPTNINDNSNKAAAEAAEEARPVERNKSQNKYSETCGGLSPLRFSFSPSGMACWPLSPLLSPGTLSSLGLATVL